MAWAHESKVDYEEVPEDVRRKAVERMVRRIECSECGGEWYDLKKWGLNNRTECPECGNEYTLVG